MRKSGTRNNKWGSEGEDHITPTITGKAKILTYEEAVEKGAELDIPDASYYGIDITVLQKFMTLTEAND